MRFFILLVLLISIGCKNETKTKEKVKIGKENVQKASPTAQSISRGKSIYKKQCAQCHLPTGKGIPKVYPPLRKSNWLTEKREESIHAVKYGLKGPITVNGKAYENIMLPLGLNDQEVTDVMNYIMNSWGNKQEKPVTVDEVKAINN